MSKSTSRSSAYVTDANQLLESIEKKSICIVDARRTEEYSAGHIPSAISLPLYDLLTDDSPRVVAQLAEDAGISTDIQTTIYDNSFGAVASRVAWTLERAGHKSISLLSVTYDQWKKSNMPIEQGQSIKENNTKFICNPNHEMGADLRTNNNNDDDKTTNHIIIDNRERLNFLDGHVPDAINIPYTMLADRNSILRSPDELQRIFANRGITPEKDVEIVTYCGSAGTLSGLAYYALKSAGITNVKMYEKSFRDWTGNNMPIEKQEDANYWDLSAE